MESVIVVFAAGFEEVEALSVVDVLRRGNIPTIMMSLETTPTVTGSRDIKVVCDQCFDAHLIETASLVVLPGGVKGTENLARHEALHTALKTRSDKALVGAICAAPSVLASIGMLDGKKATSNPGYREHMIKHPVNYQEDAVVKDGMVLTSRGMGTSLPFALELLDTLAGKTVREDVEKGLVMDSLVTYIKEHY